MYSFSLIQRPPLLLHDLTLFNWSLVFHATVLITGLGRAAGQAWGVVCLGGVKDSWAMAGPVQTLLGGSVTLWQLQGIQAVWAIDTRSQQPSSPEGHKESTWIFTHLKKMQQDHDFFPPFNCKVGREESELAFKSLRRLDSLLQAFPAILNIVMDLSMPTCVVLYQESGTIGVTHWVSNDGTPSMGLDCGHCQVLSKG